MYGSLIGSKLSSILGSLVGVDSDFGAFPGSMLVAMLGDSDSVGFGVADAADTGFLVKTPNLPIQYNDHYANSTNTPISFLEYPAYRTLGPLAPYDVPGNQSMGLEISLGQELLKLTSAPVICKIALTGSTMATHWLPTGTYPAAGSGNLYNQVVAQIHQFEVQVGKLLGAVVVNIGTNDGVLLADATAFQANMTAFVAALRVDFGAGLKVVWVKCNPGVPNANIGVVITAQQTVDTADAGMLLVDYDDVPLSGSFHATTNGYLSMGQRCATRIRQLLSIAPLTSTPAPTVVGYGPVISGTGNLVVNSWGDAQDGDLEVLDVLCGIVTGSITTPAGWTLVAASGDATAVGAHENRSVFTRPVTTALLNANNGHMPSTTVTITTATRNAAKSYCVRGPNLNPLVDTSSSFVNNAITTGPVSVTGVTTTANNALVMLLGGGFCGSDGTMVVTNAGLTNVTEVQDTSANINTDRQILNCTTGIRAVAGATGAWSATSSANMILACVTVAIKP